MGHTNSYDIDLSADGSIVTLTAEDWSPTEDDSGTVSLIYDGPEVEGKDATLVDSRRFYDVPGVSDPEGAQVNVAGGVEIDFDVPERFVQGSGVFTVFIGSEDEPSLEKAARLVRGGESNGVEPRTPDNHKLRVKLREEKHRRREAIAELRAELDELESQIDENVKDGGSENVGEPDLEHEGDSGEISTALSFTRSILNRVR